MKCNGCGNEINIKMGSKLMAKGCRVLTAVTVVVTVECEGCGRVFQIPINTNQAVVKKD